MTEDEPNRATTAVYRGNSERMGAAFHASFESVRLLQQHPLRSRQAKRGAFRIILGSASAVGRRAWIPPLLHATARSRLSNSWLEVGEPCARKARKKTGFVSRGFGEPRGVHQRAVLRTPAKPNWICPSDGWIRRC